MYRVLICGPRDFKDYDEIVKAVESSGFTPISEIIHGDATGADTLGGDYANDRKIKCIAFPADWNNIKVEGAEIAVNTFGKKYNKKAGFQRNQKMLDYLLEAGDGLTPACIAIKMKTGGTEDMIGKCKKAGVAVYEHIPYLVSKSSATGYLHEF